MPAIVTCAFVCFNVLATCYLKKILNDKKYVLKRIVTSKRRSLRRKKLLTLVIDYIELLFALVGCLTKIIELYKGFTKEWCYYKSLLSIFLSPYMGPTYILTKFCWVHVSKFFILAPHNRWYRQFVETGRLFDGQQSR